MNAQTTRAAAPVASPEDIAAREALANATWISPTEPEIPSPGARPAYLLRTIFEVSADVRRAVLSATAHGVVEFFLNGARVGDAELEPGFTAYRKRLQVVSHDVSDLLVPGRNVLVALLTDGWFRGRHGFERRADGFGARTAVLASLATEDGRVLAATDHSWETRRSHILAADLMDGERVDLREYDPAWFTGGGTGWEPVEPADGPLVENRARLVAPLAPPIRRIEELSPVALTTPRPGTTVVDFGQAINGWVRLRALGPAGTRLRLVHGEALDASGCVTTDHLRAFVFATGDLLPAGQIDEVVSAGRPGEVFEPRSTTHGFRYVQIDGPVEIGPEDVSAVVVHTDLARTGEFACSDPELERLHEVVRWSLRDNACGVPTDCPQRERSGFTGDWQIFVETGAILADVESFSESWLADLAADQWADGRIPTIVPNPGGDAPSGIAFEDPSAGSAGWGDAAAIVPWELWRAYGDLGSLARSYPAMRRWVDYAAACAASHRHPDRAAHRPEAAEWEEFLWDTGFHFGEWLEPDVPPAPDASADNGIVATAYLARSARIAAATARLLDDQEASARYSRIAEGATRAWTNEYLVDGSRLVVERQAHYVRALAFDLVPEGARPALVDRLAQLVHEAGDRLNTGFLATGMLLPVLADGGRADVAHRLLMRRGRPSWLGMLDAGATTIWERWDGLDESGETHGSLNHYSKGAVAAYLHTRLAGLRLPEFPDADEAGYRKVLIVPVPAPGITSASTERLTRLGRVFCGWRIEDGRFLLDVELPEGARADIALPDGSARALDGGAARFECDAPIRTIKA